MTRPADLLLFALRARGPDMYRPDVRRAEAWLSLAWDAYCPGCASELAGVRRLRIEEREDGGVRFSCRLGCATEAILGALRLAEITYTQTPALTLWGLESPSRDLPHIDAMIEQQQAVRSTLVALAREAA